MITFNYQKEKSQIGLVYRPVADVILEVDNFKVEVPMYIDSGADITLIPFRFGRALGFKQDSNEIMEMRGISGSGVPYMLKKVRIILKDIELEARIAWALIEDVPLLLGRMDIFTLFRITFDEAEKIVEFENVQKIKN
ncbi:MAG: hypothetical protein CVT88_02250 [Candidatus Altiarchaeales archaeon HGW-Altiarchaeales-1]|nr:MAG: hypothetical protein CVT89_02420 [Candidatus Altiarchaeales archaeon HGW-Altiarchaeales-2]PKP60731.1 MAG: hypothetical protein CVT88_02250 [Candidatus Altiarchaeales archaeon HGW-Altiarchaeales-1]